VIDFSYILVQFSISVGTITHSLLLLVGCVHLHNNSHYFERKILCNSCRLACQETRESPKKTQKPVTERLVSALDPQSASEKPLSCNNDEAEKNKP